ncbi:NAD kinase 2, mitochondrial-like [Styela clava]
MMQTIGHCSPKLYLAVNLQSNLLHRIVTRFTVLRTPRFFGLLLPSSGTKVPFEPLNQFSRFVSSIYTRTMSNAAFVHGNDWKETTHLNHVNGTSTSCLGLEDENPVLNLKQVVIVGKMTRYEFEKHRFNGCTEDEFRQAVESRGSDYDSLYAQHLKHIQTLSSIKDVLSERGIEYKVCTRGKSHTVDLINWADAIITAGGDGTFLSAASKIHDQSKPVIGINTNPNRSEGHLCLPTKYSTNLGKALDKLAAGQFRWLWRRRIRITMTGISDNFRPIHNGDMLRSRMSNTALSSLDEPEYVHRHDIITEVPQQSYNTSGIRSQVLPVLALNEVFIGESLAAVPSYYELKIDDHSSEQQKSSGLCVCTGTGSTAWSYNICRLPESAIKRVLELAAQNVSVNGLPHSADDNGSKNCKIPELSNKLIEQVTHSYSQSYIYEPDSDDMLFSVRDPMQNRVFTCRQCNGFAKKLIIRSRCWDAALCIDGEVSFTFNDGAVATLEMLPSDALRTVQLLEDDTNSNPENKPEQTTMT